MTDDWTLGRTCLSNLLNYHFQVLLAMLSSHHPVNLEVFTHVSPICTWPWMLPHGKLTITSWKTASRGPILRRRKATCPGTVKAKSMHNSNKRSWPFQANQGMMSAGGGRWFFFTKGSRFWKKPKGRFEIENRWELGKKEKYLDLLILYLWRTWLDFPDRQEVHVFTVLIFQRWNSKKMNVSVVWFGEDTCSSWDSKHYKILQSQKKKQGRGPMPHTKASQTSDGLNFWGGFISQKDLQFMKKWLPILHYFESLTLTWICVPCHLSSRLIGTSQPPHNITQEDNHWNIILAFLFRTPKSLLHIHHLFGR